MSKQLFLALLLIASVTLSAQKKKKDEGVSSETAQRPPVDTILGFAMFDGMTPFEAVDYALPAESETDPVTGKRTYYKDVKRRNDSIRKAFRVAYKKRNNTFYVTSKRPTKEGDKMKLCINLVAKDTNLLYCVVDSIMKDPEYSKVIFQQQKGDSVYVLLHIYAFSKLGGNCNGEKEQKLYFVRWNTIEGRAVWRNKYVNSCAKTITNMSKTPIEQWDGKSKLVVEYHRGTNFYEIAFDPQHPELGIQNNKEGGNKKED